MFLLAQRTHKTLQRQAKKWRLLIKLNVKRSEIKCSPGNVHLLLLYYTLTAFFTFVRHNWAECARERRARFIVVGEEAENVNWVFNSTRCVFRLKYKLHVDNRYLYEECSTFAEDFLTDFLPLLFLLSSFSSPEHGALTKRERRLGDKQQQQQKKARAVGWQTLPINLTREGEKRFHNLRPIEFSLLITLVVHGEAWESIKFKWSKLEDVIRWYQTETTMVVWCRRLCWLDFVGNEPSSPPLGKLNVIRWCRHYTIKMRFEDCFSCSSFSLATMWDILNAPRTIVWVSSQGNLKHDFSCFLCECERHESETTRKTWTVYACFIVMFCFRLILLFVFGCFMLIQIHRAELSFPSSHFRNFNNKHANWTMMMPK